MRYEDTGLVLSDANGFLQGSIICRAPDANPETRHPYPLILLITHTQQPAAYPDCSVR